MATLLDPQFKVKRSAFEQMAKSKVLEKAKEITNPSSGSNDATKEHEGRSEKQKVS